MWCVMTVAKMLSTATMNQRLRSDGDFSMADRRAATMVKPMKARASVSYTNIELNEVSAGAA